MPELPEVEVVKWGVEPHIKQQQIKNVLLRAPKLRWPIPADLPQILTGAKCLSVTRRGKYLLFECADRKSVIGHLIVHLGMSGNLQFIANEALKPAGKHDHVDVVLNAGVLRYHDPRRFGAMLWHAAKDGDVLAHPLLAKLGVEPLSGEFSAEFFYSALKTKTASIKQMLLAGQIVVGVGNIYASEVLFHAGIRPTKAANRISKAHVALLALAIQKTLAAAIAKGGSTISDFLKRQRPIGLFSTRLLCLCAHRPALSRVCRAD